MSPSPSALTDTPFDKSGLAVSFFSLMTISHFYAQRFRTGRRTNGVLPMANRSASLEVPPTALLAHNGSRLFEEVLRDARSVARRDDRPSVVGRRCWHIADGRSP